MADVSEYRLVVADPADLSGLHPAVAAVAAGNDQACALRFREEILENGGSRGAMAMFIAFRGREPVLEALLRQRGLLR